MSRNRLRKKCFIVSLGMHLLLLLVVMFGVAFATTRKKEEPVKYLSLTLFREPAPQAAPQPVQPIQARRIPEQQPSPRTEPPKPREKVQPRKAKSTPKVKTKPNKTTPKKTTPKKTNKPSRPKKKSTPKNKSPRIPKINISNRVVNKSGKSGTSSKTPRANSSKPLKVVSVNPNAVSNLKNKLSSSVRAVTFRPGSSSYSNFKEWVRQKYQQTWNNGRLPSQRYRQVVTVQVAVSRSGRVISARIVRRSGKAPLDASVQATLNVVKTIGRSFPAGVKEARQTFTIDFQMR